MGRKLQYGEPTSVMKVPTSLMGWVKEQIFKELARRQKSEMRKKDG